MNRNRSQFQVLTLLSLFVIFTMLVAACTPGDLSGAAGGTPGKPVDTDTPVPPPPADTDTPVPPAADTDTPVPSAADTDTPVPPAAATDTQAGPTDTPQQVAAADTATPDKGGGTTKITICHATGSATNPYVTITVSVRAADGTLIGQDADHTSHAGDIIPAPAGGCPAGSSDTPTPGGSTATPDNNKPQKITLCHATGSATNPYVEITVSVRAADGAYVGQDGTDHTHHVDDIIPAPASGCPTGGGDTPTPSPKKISLCHATGSATNPYVEITVSVNAVSGQHGHEGHAGDIIPAPAGGCPVPTPPTDQPKKISLCHATGSATNPYVLITVSTNAVSGQHGHEGHAGDIIPAPAGGCPIPTGEPTKTPEPKKISLCHATGSATNPYVLITVSINAVSNNHGHEGHAGDVIPAPANGCPTNNTATPTATTPPTATPTTGVGTPTATPAPTDTPAPTSTPTLTPPPSTPPPPPPPEINIVAPPAPNPATCPQFIVFHSFRSGTLEIFRQDGVEGTNARIINLSQGEGSRPSRSKDDRFVVFESGRTGTVELYLSLADGSSLSQLTYTNANNINPMVGSDNRSVVYQSDRNGNWDIFILDVNTLEERQLTTDAHNDVNPFWSPDAKWIVFQSDRTGSSDVLLVEVATGQEFTVTRAVADETFPSWSPNGRKLAFISNVSGQNELYVVDVSGDNVQQITLDGDAGNYSWSPEGNRLAYQDLRGGSLDVYTYDLRDNSEYRLTNGNGINAHPSWDCGGTKIAFTATRDGDPNLLQVNWQGGSASNLTVNTASDKWAEWSPSKEIGSQGH